MTQPDPNIANTSPKGPVKTNIITGFLGAGKTTAIQHLLQHKPQHERWAILVNEFGEVGIDGALHKGTNTRNHAAGQQIFVKEVPGGCMCCTSGLPMQIALNQLLAKAQPDRLLIEPTGIGHPKTMRSTLSEPQYRDILTLGATLTLVDARKVGIARYRAHPTFQEQLCVADRIIASKADQYTSEDLPALEQYLHHLGLANTPVSAVQQGAIELAWLDQKPKLNSHRPPEPMSDATSTQAISTHTSPLKSTPSVRFVAMPNANNALTNIAQPKIGSLITPHDFPLAPEQAYYADGWIFSPHQVFDFYAIMGLLTEVDAERIKAVFITEKGIYGFNKADSVLTCIELDESDDSRIEYITTSKEEAKQLNAFLSLQLKQAIRS